ncbi:hypothetical protein AB0J27_31705 [Micromonospora chokoriensis]
MSDLLTANRRQAGLTALYLGIFAMVWFSVPAAEQPLRALLVVGSIAALLTAVLGGVLSARLRGPAAPGTGQPTARTCSSSSPSSLPPGWVPPC